MVWKYESKGDGTLKKKVTLKRLALVVVVILSILSLSNIIKTELVMPINLLLLGIINISNGYSSYVKNKKREALLLILSGLFIIFVAAFTSLTPINLVK